MKKYTLLLHQQDFTPLLGKIQEAGVVHLTEKVCDIDTQEQQILKDLNACSEAIEILSAMCKEEEKCNGGKNSKDEKFSATMFATIKTEYDSVSEQLQQKTETLEDLLHWGNFNIDKLSELKKNGIDINFFVCENYNFDNNWQEQYNLEVISQTKKQTFFVIINDNISETTTQFNIPANEVDICNKGTVAQLKQDIDTLKNKAEELKKRLLEMTVFLPQLHQEKVRLLNELNFDRATQCIDSECEEQIRIIEGFIPAENAESFNKLLNAENVYYYSEEPSVEDDVPILLKNNKFAKLFEPITKIFALPKYTELDLTPFLAPFFMMFVGFCAGDAGYGLLIVLLGFFIKKKLKTEFRPIVSLAQILGLSTVVFGTLTGTFFGIELVSVGALKSVKEYFLTQDNMMVLALALGGVQIIFGMIVNIANVIISKGWKYSIGKIGWVSLIILALVAFGLPYIGIAVGGQILYALYGLMGAALIAIFFFNSPGKNVFLQFGVGIWDAYSVATGMLGDILSYVRLFALGLTGGVLGMVFNTLAMDMAPENPILKVVVAVIILLIGHSLNLCLTLLGAIVHPIRLTFVEFYKNAGFEGGGKEYAPLKKV